MVKVHKAQVVVAIFNVDVSNKVRDLINNCAIFGCDETPLYRVIYSSADIYYWIKDYRGKSKAVVRELTELGELLKLQKAKYFCLLNKEV